MFLGAGCTETAPDVPNRTTETTTSLEPAGQEDSIDDNDFLNQAFAQLYDRVSELGFESLSQPELTVYLVLSLNEELQQGGIEYYFYRPAGNHADETAFALEKIGAQDAADRLRDSFAVFKTDSPPTVTEERQSLLDTIDESESQKLQELSTSLIDSLKELESLLSQHIEQNNLQFDSDESNP